MGWFSFSKDILRLSINSEGVWVDPCVFPTFVTKGNNFLSTVGFLSNDNLPNRVLLLKEKLFPWRRNSFLKELASVEKLKMKMAPFSSQSVSMYTYCKYIKLINP